MNQLGWVQITDSDGWRKEFPLQKNLVHIGSAASNDIVLDSSRGMGVAPRHLQLVAASGGAHYRAINLGDTDILRGEQGETVISPRSAVSLSDGDLLRVGDFDLVFKLSTAGGAPAWGDLDRAPAHAGAAEHTFSGEQSSVIGLQLSMPAMALHPDHPLEGTVTVRNQGDQPGVQFMLELEGIEPDCYEIGSGPILFPNVEKGVFLRVFHPRRPVPAAGKHRIQICATAPEAYPGERATVIRDIQVLPFYKHELRLEPVD
jgi:hypothetical protein